MRKEDGKKDPVRWSCSERDCPVRTHLYTTAAVSLRQGRRVEARTVIAVVIICAQVKSMLQTREIWPVTLAQPVTQLAKAECRGLASLAEK
jgi:hypothetical protein